MNRLRFKIRARYFYKSFVWLIFPICLFGGIKSCTEYRDAGRKMISPSVSVSGYYRSDGTYVRPYKRRPPGGVAHDAPYKRKRFYMGFLFIVSIAGGIGSVLAYTGMSNAEIRKQEKVLEDLEREKKEAEKRKKINEILFKISFDFSKLPQFPSRLKNKPPPFVRPHSIYGGGGPRKCKFCNLSIVKNTFYVSFVPVSKTHYVCMTCVKQRESIGKNQPQSIFRNEILYVDTFNVLLEKFKISFMKEAESTGFNLGDVDLELIFNEELKKIKKNLIY